MSTSSNDVKVSAENGKLDRASVWTGHAWLRVQELHPSLVQSVHVGELVCFSDPTTAMFLCPLTAKKLRLSHGQLVTLSEFSVKTRLHNLQSGEQESVFPTEADGFELGNGRVKVKTAGRRVVVRAVVTDLAKPGHIMLAQSLQTYLGLSCHASKLCDRFRYNNYLLLTSSVATDCGGAFECSYVMIILIRETECLISNTELNPHLFL